MSNIAKVQRQALRDTLNIFTEKWNTNNPEDKIELRIMPITAKSEDKKSMKAFLNLELKRNLVYSVLLQTSATGPVADEELLTAHTYASMFVRLMETALLISLANLDRQHEERQGSGDQIVRQPDSIGS